MDFWRPFNHTEALVNGKFSANIYVDFFKKVFSIYRERTGAKLEDFAALLFHLPYTKQGLKGLRAAIEGADPKLLDKTGYEEMLEKREKISVSEYEKVFSSLEMRAENLELNIDDDPAVFVFAGIEEYSRKYLKK